MEDARRADSSDVGLISELRQAGRDQIGAERGGVLFLRRESPPESGRTDLTSVLGDPDRALWVGTVSGHVAGYGLGHIERLDGGSLHGVLDELYVEPQARGVGVGEAVLEGILEWFVARGCGGVDATALPGDRSTKSFLESGGFKARLIVLHRSLLG